MHRSGFIVLTCFAALSALPPAAASAADAWLSVSSRGAVIDRQPAQPAGADVIALEVDATGLALTAHFDAAALTVRENRAGRFLQLNWPGAAPLGEIGSPRLPVLRRLVVIPDGARARLNVVEGSSVMLDLAEAGYPTALWPRQAPIEKTPGARENAPFDFNGRAYAIDRMLPIERVTLTELGVVRGHRLALLEVRPVAYNPATGVLRLWPEMDVSVRFRGGRAAGPEARALGALGGMLLNPPAAPRGLNYLIVIADAYAGAIDPFVTGKTDQGFDVMTYEVPGGTSNTTIKNYIESLWGTADQPDYILLVGDTNTIPRWTGQGSGSPDTDLQYACMDGGGDWYPDIPIGRFPVRSTGALADVIEKTLFIEGGTYPDQDYVLRAVFMASEDNYTVSEGTHNYVIDNYMDPNGFTSDKLYCHTYNANSQQVRDAFNNGRIYGVFSGHGSPDGWHDGPAFFRDDVRDLFNEGLYSFVLSFSCSTGDYHDTTECFTETFLLEGDKGAAAVYGSSVSSYWDEDDKLERFLFDVIYGDDIREVSPAWQAAFLLYLDYYGPTDFTRRYFEMYNLMGDPSLFIPLPGGGADMRVSPIGGFHPEGPNGGPFTPESTEYTVINNADQSISYEVSTDAPWLDLDNASGVIPVGGSVDVTVSVNGYAENLGNGLHESVIEFVNTTNHDGDCTRDASLEIGVPVPIYTFNMDSDPGWSGEGLWAFGQPTGGGGDHGGPDPTGGYTGNYVCGYNLNGDYENYLSERHLTTDAIDC
ncbi:MAG: C25 family cysteine peptidase, partial [Planctomycetota bacterium]|nr:C25 family cysteine peptidase [Planctomycetota bacterium]